MRPAVNRIVLSLPMPPSVNALFLNRASGGRARTKMYNEWIVEAGWRIQMQNVGMIAGPYEIDIKFARLSKRSDLGNREKALSDLLVKHGILEDDRLAERICMSWAPEGEGVLVTLTKWSASA